MTTEDLEELQFELESLLYTKTQGELNEFAVSIKVDVELAGKSKIAATKLIQKSIEQRLNAEGELAQKVEWVQNAIKSLKPESQENVPDDALSELKKQIEELKLKQQTEMDKMLSKLATKTVHETKDDADKLESPKETKSSASESFLRREFKISGQIGEPGQTDKLTFVSLTHQIDSGLKRQYKECEIVDAVIRAISLHSSLRSYVETLNDLSLPKLRKILRVHYREKSASELYQQLATIFQHPKETAQQFLLRALDLRNKVGFASKESDCEVHYDEPLIQKTFVKSFETGLRDDILAANLRPILRSSPLTDEDLMRHVNELASHQAERQNKLASERRLAKINSCEVDESKKSVDSNQQILAEIREMRTEVENLKRQQATRSDYVPKDNRNESYNDRGPPKTTRFRGQGCQACKKRKLGATCRHCFACGELGHIASECEKNIPRQNQGNGRRLPQTWDRD
jgi:hypothetical protein